MSFVVVLRGGGRGREGNVHSKAAPVSSSVIHRPSPGLTPSSSLLFFSFSTVSTAQTSCSSAASVSATY